MASVSRNLKAIRGLVDDIHQQVREQRNNAVRQIYHEEIPPESQDSVTFMHGRSVYRDKSLETFLQLINNRPVWMPIRFIALDDDNSLLAKAANDVFSMVRQRAWFYKDTGEHFRSVEMYVRQVGRPARAFVRGQVSASQLPDRSVIGIIARTPYASTLEARGVIGGVLYYVAQQARSKYKGQLAIKYNYISGQRFGEGGGTYPQIQIGHIGNVKERLQRPGKSL